MATKQNEVRKCLDCIHVHVCYLLKIVYESNEITTNPPTRTRFLFAPYYLGHICQHYKEKGE